MTPKQERRIARRQSPPELVNVYDWVRENIFLAGYIPSSNKIIFSYKRNGSGGAWCKGAGFKYKEIRFSRWYRGIEMYKTMIHEALHLRLPHHRKSFKIKEQELLKILETKNPPLSAEGSS